MDIIVPNHARSSAQTLEELTAQEIDLGQIIASGGGWSAAG
ncbi:MAG: hypothetical protein ACRDTA_19045 [Pseudonocardiaceae bacterium]